jgi:hypothetical protein
MLGLGDSTLDGETIIAELKRYEGDLAGILSRFTRSRDGIHIGRGDDPLFQQYVRKLVDLFNDVLGSNAYSAPIIGELNEGVSNFIGSPSYKSDENILSVVRASLTRFTRNTDLMARKMSEDALRRRENLFVIHGGPRIQMKNSEYKERRELTGCTMKNLVTVIWIGFLTALPVLTFADTIVLKNGRVIEASSCWEEERLIRCRLHGQIVGYPKNAVREVIKQTPPPASDSKFVFDIWPSGITVMEAIDIAQAYDKPLHKSGLISASKTFNPRICLPYADTATQFYYKDQIFGRLATLTLDFTPTSKLLYSVRVAFSGPGISRASEFRELVESMMREKYGEPMVTDKIVFRDYEWAMGENATVTMRQGGNSVHVTYRDRALANEADHEKSEKVREGFTQTDKGKF